MDKNTVIGIAGLIIAIITLFFGDNLYEQINGHSFFSAETPISTPTPSNSNLYEAPEKTSSNFLETINATKVEVKFFESNDEFLPIEQRVYTNKFNKTARNINVDLKIEYQTYFRKVDVDLDHEIYNSNGTIQIGRSTGKSISSFSPFSSSANISWRFSNDWFVSDIYTVVIYADDIEIARASFTRE